MARPKVPLRVVPADEDGVVSSPRPPLRVDIEAGEGTAWCRQRDATQREVGSDLFIFARLDARAKERGHLVHGRRRDLLDGRREVHCLERDALALALEQSLSREPRTD
jgi:hypothetical protein